MAPNRIEFWDGRSYEYAEFAGWPSEIREIAERSAYFEEVVKFSVMAVILGYVKLICVCIVLFVLMLMVPTLFDLAFDRQINIWRIIAQTTFLTVLLVLVLVLRAPVLLVPIYKSQPWIIRVENGVLSIARHGENLRTRLADVRWKYGYWIFAREGRLCYPVRRAIVFHYRIADRPEVVYCGANEKSYSVWRAFLRIAEIDECGKVKAK